MSYIKVYGGGAGEEEGDPRSSVEIMSRSLLTTSSFSSGVDVMLSPSFSSSFEGPRQKLLAFEKDKVPCFEQEKTITSKEMTRARMAQRGVGQDLRRQEAGSTRVH